MLEVSNIPILALPTDELLVSTLLECEQLLERESRPSFAVTPNKAEGLPYRFPDLPIAGANNAICLGKVPDIARRY